MSESERRMIEILRILNKQEKPTGSKLIADELKEKGFNLGERAVRYHMQILDEKGFTERKGYSGREITELGREKLEKGLIYDQVDFIYSKFQELIYLTDFNYMDKKGNVVVNTSTIYSEESYDILKNIFTSGLSVSHYVNINRVENQEPIEIKTICGTTIDGILLNEGIVSQPLYGGLLKIEDYRPISFEELISYKKTSISPLDAFIAPKMTSVLEVMNEGTGYIPANFRLIPSVGKEKTMTILSKLQKIGIGGIIAMSEDGENILGLPVDSGMVGIGIIGGITPFCALQELGHDINIKIGEELENFNELKPITSNMNNELKEHKQNIQSNVSFILSKSWNLIQQVDLDMEKKSGNIIANISYINKEDIDEAIETMQKSYELNKKYVNPHFQIISHPEDENKVGIATICSLSIDGLLIKNGIKSMPKYGGLLELTEPPLFIDLISYTGSSIDPHKIFIAKDMTSIISDNRPKRLLASLKEIPFVARDHSVYLLDKLSELGLPIYKIGKPRELTYNAKVDNYYFGLVTGSGLNTIAAIKEKGIDIEVKAATKLMPFESMDKL